MVNENLNQKSENLVDVVELMNGISGKIFNLLCTGGEYGAPSEDNFYCWLTPSQPVDKSEFDFAREGLSGVVRAKLHSRTSGETSPEEKTLFEQKRKQLIERIANKQPEIKTKEQFGETEEDLKRKNRLDMHDEREDAHDRNSMKKWEDRKEKEEKEKKGKEASAESAESDKKDSQPKQPAQELYEKTDTLKGEPIVDHGIGDPTPKQPAHLVEDETRGLSPEDLELLKSERTYLLYLQAERFANLVNFIPDVSGHSKTGINHQGLSILENEGSLSDVYQYILNMSQVMETDKDPKMEEKIAKLKKLLVKEVEKKNILAGLLDDDEKQEPEVITEPSDLVRLYEEKMNAYELAALRYNNKRIAALEVKNTTAVHDWALNGRIYYNAVKFAYDDWVANGYKNEFEQISAIINQVEGRSMCMLKEDYLKTFKRSMLTSLVSGNEFPFTTLIPANFAENEWETISYNASDYHDSDKSMVRNHSVNVNLSQQSWFSSSHVDSTTESNKQDDKIEIDLSTLTVSMEICQVQIVRPWFKPAFLHSKYWRFDQRNEVAKDQMASTGLPNPEGMLPAYPTSMILVRNAVFDFHSESAAEEFMHRYHSHQFDSGAAGGFFIFSARTGFSLSTENTKTESENTLKQEGGKVEFPGMHIVGYRCHLMDKAPDPNPAITKWI